MRQQVSYFPLQGGEDLLSPPLTVKPGRLLYSLNYECDASGRYRRIAGFERLDGRAAPSDASYTQVCFENGDTAPTVGDTIRGVTSGASGELLATVISSGAFADGDADGYFILALTSGAFTAGEDLVVVQQITNASVETEVGSPSITQIRHGLSAVSSLTEVGLVSVTVT